MVKFLYGLAQSKYKWVYFVFLMIVLLMLAPALFVISLSLTSDPSGIMISYLCALLTMPVSMFGLIMLLEIFLVPHSLDFFRQKLDEAEKENKNDSSGLGN